MIPQTHAPAAVVLSDVFDMATHVEKCNVAELQALSVGLGEIIATISKARSQSRNRLIMALCGSLSVYINNELWRADQRRQAALKKQDPHVTPPEPDQRTVP